MVNARELVSLNDEQSCLERAANVDAESCRLVSDSRLSSSDELVPDFGSVLRRDEAVRNRSPTVEARSSLTDVDLLLSSLGTQHEYALTRFIYPPPTNEPPDTVSLSSRRPRGPFGHPAGPSCFFRRTGGFKFSHDGRHRGHRANFQSWQGRGPIQRPVPKW